MSEPSLIQANNLSKTYRLDGLVVPALRGVNLEVKTGELLAIMGPSGCGKSTLMHLLGLLDHPSLGEVVFRGKPVSDFSESEAADFRNRQVGFVFQQFNLLARISALENVLLPTIYNRWSNKEDFLTRSLLSQRAEQILVEVGLYDRMDHKPNQLSGGEQQRLAIARALVNDPALILADEPTGNLDSLSGRQILSLLQTLNRKGRTVVVVTHDANVAAVCQRIIKMRDGEIID